jgi:hypothetical protein
MSISQLAETLMAGKLKERRDRDTDNPIGALLFLIENIAQESRASAGSGRICEWNTDPTVFETFRIAVAKLLDWLRPHGEIDTSVEGPLVGRSPEQEAEAIFRKISTGLLSAEDLDSTQINALIAQRGWRPMPHESIAAISAGLYSAVKVREALNIKADGGKHK